MQSSPHTLVYPDTVSTPTGLETVALPVLWEPGTLPGAPVPALRDHEPLVAITHPRIEVIPVYWRDGRAGSIPEAYLRAEAACRLAAAAETLPDGFGLVVLDAWRPLCVQAALRRESYHNTDLPEGFVAPASEDPAAPPAHLTGGTVDVSLSYNGVALALGSNFDEFTEAAWAAAFENSAGRVRELRRVLYTAMSSQGFIVLKYEWWHFEIGTRRWSAITGEPVWYSAAVDPRSE
jgi:D-alanyl-D-alanine dipeptidase